jgi:D-3-phosphoglycerate dehydrogenase / 2-oxoglutarate reductase
MKAKVVMTEPELRMLEAVLPDLSKRVNIVTLVTPSEAGWKQVVTDAHVIVTCYTRITAKIITAAPHLLGIVKYGVGVDSIDLKAANQAGIIVANCPIYGSETIAEHAFALMICLSRKIMQMDRSIRTAGWEHPTSSLLGNDLVGKVLGIIGCGRVGRAMASRAASFHMHCIAYDPYADVEDLARERIDSVGLDELLDTSDIVTVHAVLTPETRGLIGERELRRMKPTALIINVARGAIIDEFSLVSALLKGWIAGAGLDVFTNEPLPPDHALISMDNVILTPHLAWYTREAYERLERDTLQNLLDILDGKAPQYIKNPEALPLFSERMKKEIYF